MEIKVIDNKMKSSLMASETVLVKQKIFQKITKHLANSFSKIVLDDRIETPPVMDMMRQKDTLFIINKNPIQLNKSNITSTFSGTTIPLHINMFPAELKIAFKDIKDDNGLTVAKMLSNVVFTVFDVFAPYKISIEEKDKVDKKSITEKNTNYLAGFFKKIASNIEIIEPEELYNKLYRDKLVFIMRRQIEQKAKSYREKIEENEKLIEQYQKQLTDTIRNITIFNKLLSSLEKDDNLQEKAEHMIDTIRKMNLVKDVIINPEAEEEIKIITKDIVLTDTDSKKYNLGGYEIIYKDGAIKIMNLLAKKKGYEYQHPHIKTNSICWGNLSSITKYIANYEYDVATSIVLSALQTWNPNDAYIKLSEIVKNLDLKPIKD